MSAYIKLSILFLLFSFQLHAKSTNWINYTNTNPVQQIIYQNDELWAATIGGVVNWKLNSSTPGIYRSSDGLLTNYATSICAGLDSRIYVGTMSGLCCFSENSWFDLTRSMSCPEELINDLVVDASGNVWFCTLTGLYLIQNNQLLNAQTDLGIPDTGIYSLASSDFDSTVWAGSQGKIFEIHRKRFLTYDLPDEFSKSRITSIFVNRQNTVYIYTSNSILFLKGSEWQMLKPIFPDQNVFINSIAEDEQQRLWAGYGLVDSENPCGASYFDGINWQHVMDPDSVLQTRVNDLVIDEQNRIWFATDAGIVCCDGNSWNYYFTNDNLPDNDIQDFKIDKNQNFWIASTNGLICGKKNQWAFHPLQSGNSNSYLLTLDISPAGQVWCGGDWGLSFYNDEWCEAFVEINGKICERVKDVLCDSRGNIWVGTSVGLHFYNGSEWRTFTYADGLTDNKVYVVGEDSAGTIWAGTKFSGLCSWDGSSWTSHRKEDGLAGDNPRVICTTSTGQLWIGFSVLSGYTGGLSCKTENGWQNYTTSDGLISTDISALFADSGNRLWIGTAAGVSVFDGEFWCSYDCRDGLGSNFVSAIQEDGDGNLWFGCGVGGLSCLLKQESGVPTKSKQPESVDFLNLSIFPNPLPLSGTSEMLTLHYSIPEKQQNEIGNLTVFNLMGQKIFSQSILPERNGAGEILWRISDITQNTFSTGLYFINLQVGKERVCKKLLVVK